MSRAGRAHVTGEQSRGVIWSGAPGGGGRGRPRETGTRAGEETEQTMVCEECQYCDGLSTAEGSSTALGRGGPRDGMGSGAPREDFAILCCP